MKKITHWFLFYSILYLHSGAVNANSMIFDKYAWTNRLLIMITDKKNTDLEKQVRQFFESHVCDIDDRNLKLLHFYINEVEVPVAKETLTDRFVASGIRRLNQGF